MDAKKILVVDDSQSIRAVLLKWLSADYRVRAASSGEEALAMMADDPADLVLCDINMPGIDGFETLKHVRERWPATRTALITDYNVDTYIQLALEKDVANIIAKSAPFDADELLRTVDNLLSGERLFGLAHYLAPGSDIRIHRVRSADDLKDLRDAVLDAWQKGSKRTEDITGLCVVFEEAVSNALFHAYGYAREQRVYLKPTEVVEVAFGHDATRFGLAVTDYSGRLTKQTVLCKIIRASSDESAFDPSGRGLFLSRAISDRLLINVKSGVKTEIIAFKYFEVFETVNHPLYINEV